MFFADIFLVSHSQTLSVLCNRGKGLATGDYHFPESSVTKMAAAGSFFVTVLCVICRYHVYKGAWSPNIGEDFVSFAKEENVTTESCSCDLRQRIASNLMSADDSSVAITVV